MDLTWNSEEIAFRDEVRAFLREKFPTDLRDKCFRHQRLKKEDYIRWHRLLAERGWGAPNWPKEYGGTGWSAVQRLIFEIETFKAGAPRLLSFA